MCVNFPKLVNLQAFCAVGPGHVPKLRVHFIRKNTFCAEDLMVQLGPPPQEILALSSVP